MDQRIQYVIAIMQRDLDTELSLDKMAHSVNLSLWHLCRLFKAETGLPPARYLKILRMRRAQALLESTFLSVKEIMNKIGLSDESHFVRDFKSIYGYTPVQHRTFHLSIVHRTKRRQEWLTDSNIGQ
jgi:AraC family transcriptional regulator